jgi:uncharacterized repeat protein (TIGR01451 family)
VIANPATVSSPTPDADPSNNSSTATITVQPPPQADVTVTTTTGSSVVSAGQNVTYTIVVTNNGPTFALSMAMQDSVPSNTTFQSVMAPVGWTCSAPPAGGTGTLTCTYPSLVAGSPASFTVVLNVNSGTPLGTVINNTASASSSQTADPNPANNSSTASVTVSNLGGGGQAITFRAASGTDSAGRTLSINQPSGVVANDVLVAAIYWDNSAPTAITPPSGFTLIRTDGSSANQAVSLYYHVAGDTEPAAYVWSASRSTGFSGIISAYSGVDTANPIEVHAGATGTTSGATAPSVTSTIDGDWLVDVWSAWTSNVTLGPPSGMTSRQSFNRSDPLLLADKALGAAGATGTQTATTAPAPALWTGQAVVLRRAP